MHPNAAFRPENRTLFATLVDEVGFGTVFAATPDGPRVAHVPLLLEGDRLLFHLARGNALARHLHGMTALAVVNGPDAYVSPRWYADPAQVPTWNYLAVELEGPVQRVDQDALHAMLDALSARHEARIAEGTPWTMDKMPEAKLRAMMAGIVGFALEVQAWRGTAKLSQNKPAEERDRALSGLEAAGSAAMAALMRAIPGTSA